MTTVFACLSVVLACLGVGASTAFAAPPTGDPSACPNAQLRSEQVSTTLPSGTTFLPDCRALELVTPPQKFNQYAVEGQIGVTDDRVEFTSLSALNSPRLGSILDKYMAERSSTGWRTQAMQMGSEYTNGNVATGLPCAIAPDISNWTTYASTESQAKLGIVSVLQQDSAGDVYRLGPLLSPFNTVGPFAVGNSQCAGGSADGSHFYVAIKGAVYGPEDPPASTGGEDIYDTYNTPQGEPRAELIQRDRDGTVVGGACGSLIAGESQQGTTSPDGSWLYFVTRPGAPNTSCSTSTYAQRVMRRDLGPTGPEITEVGESECDRVTPACNLTNGNDNFQAASADGTKVFLTTTRQLTNSDLDTGSSCSTNATAPSAGCDLYLYDYSKPPGSRLTQISVGDSSDPTPGSGAEVLGVAAISGDGSHAYFVARGVLTTAPNEFGATAQPAARNLYVWEKDAAHPTGYTAFIGDLATTDTAVWTAQNHMAAAVPMLGTDLQDHAVGGDGHVLALLSDAALTPDDTDGGYADLFRYDSTTGALERLSRAAPGGEDNGPYDVSFGGVGKKSNESSAMGEYGAEPSQVFKARRISENGETAVFVTGEKLSPADTDGEESVYIWEDGNLVPVPSAGTPSVSASGQEVAFTTGKQLLVEDGDGASDVYVARVDGGFPIPRSPILCAGEACQGPLAAQPSGGSSATEGTTGSGNVQPKKQKKHKKRAHHHRKCQKKKKCQKKCHQKKCRGTKQQGKHKEGRGHKNAGRKQGGQK